MKSNHVNYVDNSGRVYCFRVDRIVSYGKGFFETFCSKCPYFKDSANMQGVECFFDDACGGGAVIFDDSSDSELHSKMVAVRLNLKTEAQVHRSLQGYGAENSQYLEVKNPSSDDIAKEEKASA